MAGRRGAGEGSIYERDDGRWEAKIDLGYVNGKRKRVSFYGKTRSEVRDKMTKALHDKQRGLPVHFERQTVEQFMHEWLEHTVKPNRRPKTYISYEQLTRLYITPALGRIQLQQLTPQHVQKLINETHARGLSAATVQRMHATLRGALNQALRWGVVPRNVATLVDVPRKKSSRASALSPTEARALLEAARGHRLYALFAVALATGLRKGELLGLQWGNVDFEREVLTVRGQLQNLHGLVEIVPAKSARGHRSVRLPEFATAALVAHRATQAEELSSRLYAQTDMDLVFRSTSGTPLDNSNVTREFHRLLEQAGVQRVRFHDLRHSCATFLLTENVHPRVVMETLGHSQMSVTMDLYSHVVPALQEEVAAKLDWLLGGGIEESVPNT